MDKKGTGCERPTQSVSQCLIDKLVFISADKPSAPTVMLGPQPQSAGRKAREAKNARRLEEKSKHLWEPCREYSDSRIGAVSGRKATDTRCIGRIKLLQKGRVLWDG